MDGGMSKLMGMGGDGGPAGGASLDLDGGLSSVGSALGMGAGSGGAGGLIDMAMGIVYPMMKPMMEASIRKITITVRWKEGPNPQEFVLAQFVTNPQSGGFMGGGMFGDGGVLPTSSATPATTGTTTTTRPAPVWSDPLKSRVSQRGLTLVEVLVALAVLAMIGVLLYGAFDSLSHGKKAEGIRGDRARQGRQAILRMTREIQSAFLSMHNPANVSLQTRVVAFVGQNSQPFDRLDFQAFAHRRIVANSHESDQAEVGYFAAADPDVDGKMDLVRREQTPPDMEREEGRRRQRACART